MATVRARRGAQCFLLSVYDSEGVQQLGLELGRSPVFLYEDQHGQPTPDLYPIFKKVNLADGKYVPPTSILLYPHKHVCWSYSEKRGESVLSAMCIYTLFSAFDPIVN